MKIIRTRQRPFLVIVDIFFTVLAWIGLLYLMIRGLWPLVMTHGGPRLVDSSFLDALGTLQIYLWVALFNAALLISWARAQKRKSKSFAQRRASVPVAGDEELSKSFKLTGDRLERMRQLGTMVIHNDEAGDVSDVDTRFFRIDSSKQSEVNPLASLDEQKKTLLADSGHKAEDEKF